MKFKPDRHEALIAEVEASRSRHLHIRHVGGEEICLWFTQDSHQLLRHFSSWRITVRPASVYLRWEISVAVGRGRVGPSHGITSGAFNHSLESARTLDRRLIRGFDCRTESAFENAVRAICAFSDQRWCELSALASRALGGAVRMNGYIPMLSFFMSHADLLSAVAAGHAPFRLRTPNAPLSLTPLVQQALAITGDAPGSPYYRVGVQGVELWPHGDPTRYISDAFLPYCVANVWYDNRAEIQALVGELTRLASAA